MRNAAAPTIALLVAASALWAASACGSFSSADAPLDTTDGAAAADGPGGEASLGPDGDATAEPRRIYVIGGEVPGVEVDGGGTPFTNSVVFTTQEPDGRLAPWTETEPLAYLHGNAAVASGGAIVTLGGEVQDPFGASASTVVNRATILGDGGLDTWLTTQPLINALYFHATVAVNGYVYVMGGSTPMGPLATVRFATLAANGAIGTWTETTPLPAPRSRLAAASDGAHIFVVGGGSPVDGGAACDSDVLVGTIGPTGEILGWARAGAAYSSLSPAVAVFAKKQLFVLGGFACVGGTSSQVLSADINLDGTVGKFTTRAPLPFPRSGFGAVVLGQQLYVVGGNDGTTRVPDVSVANLDSAGGYESWAVGSALPTGRSLFGIAAH